jgi:hypothetical protein
LLRASVLAVEAPKQFESSIDPKKKEIIERVYFDDLTSYRSIKDTWKQARKIDPDIKLQDVSQWKAELEPRKTDVAGYNSFIANAPYKEFKKEKIRHLTTLGHAHAAERTIRTIKDLYYNRMDKIMEEKDWEAILEAAVKAYNTKHVRSAIQTTPEKAKAPRNKAEVKENLEQTRVMTRRYPKLVVGSKVRLFHKKDKDKKSKYPFG